MQKSGGGFKAIKYSLKVASEVGVKNFVQSVFSKNACKTCALGMGGQSGGMINELGHFPEICKKSMQAQLTDIQAGIPNSVFLKSTIENFKKVSGKDLEKMGRLENPLYKNEADTHYKPISWDEAISRIVLKMKSTTHEKTFFYASGRSSNEAAFLLQLFARVYGTNNVNNCSYYCHQASGVGLSASLGIGTATIVLEDVSESDLIFVIGANPASNHPRFVRELLLCRRRGGKVIVINPAKELGLVRFAVPSDFKSMINGGSEIASDYVQPNIGGDIAFFKGVAKVLFENGKVDKNFIQNYTNNYEDFEKDIKSTTWEEILHVSGVLKFEIERVANLYANAKNVIFSWAMGITHHDFGVENVQTIVNIALLRGMIGRKNAGLLPLRGHSNVQGVGSVGVAPSLRDKIFKNIEEKMGIKLPTEKGMDTMACVEAAFEGKIDFALLLGGNLYGSNPDSNFAEKSLNNIPFKVFLNTTLNKGHFFGVEKEVVILPVLARDEEKQPTTQESMFNFVRLSDGGILRLKNVRSEIEILSEIAEKVLGNSKINFGEFQNHNKIRKAIALTIPGFEKIENIGETKSEFQISGRTFHEPKFKTNDQKANFKIFPIPELKGKNGNFRMMTVRSEGQFNTIVYDDEDTYRGQTERWVVLMNKQDIDERGFVHNGKVTIENEVGKMENVTVREFDILKGNVMTYYPESNVLVPKGIDKQSKTPSFKSVEVKIINC